MLFGIQFAFCLASDFVVIVFFGIYSHCINRITLGNALREIIIIPITFGALLDDVWLSAALLRAVF